MSIFEKEIDEKANTDLRLILKNVRDAKLRKQKKKHLFIFSVEVSSRTIGYSMQVRAVTKAI